MSLIVFAYFTLKVILVVHYFFEMVLVFSKNTVCNCLGIKYEKIIIFLKRGFLLLPTFLVIIFCCFKSSQVFAKTDKIESEKYRIGYFKEALSRFNQDNGRFPNSLEGLNFLVINNNGYVNWHGPYVNYPLIPTDSWGSDYVYIHPTRYGGRNYDLYSIGPNKIDEHGNGDDILQSK